MAFQESSSKERFSLLLLEPGEIYFEDYSCFCYPGKISESEACRRNHKGRLKVCSKSILFDPKDVCNPILKLGGVVGLALALYAKVCDFKLLDLHDAKLTMTEKITF
ncbi:protein FAN [Trichonephila clavipes]|nr:protein FAN [Trichonephila clavipes]